MQCKLSKLKNIFLILLTIVLLSAYFYRMACYSIPQTTYQRTDIVMFGFGDLILVLFQYPHVITLPLLLIFFAFWKQINFGRQRKCTKTFLKSRNIYSDSLSVPIFCILHNIPGWQIFIGFF